MLRKGSSVFRAPRSFGYAEVGGSNPSPSTIARIAHERKALSVRNDLAEVTRATVGCIREFTNTITRLAGSFPPAGTNVNGIVAQRSERHIASVIRMSVGSNPPYPTKRGVAYVGKCGLLWKPGESNEASCKYFGESFRKMQVRNRCRAPNNGEITWVIQ